jgi:hypothetical protein
MSERMEGARRLGEARQEASWCVLEDEDIYFNMCTYLADHLRRWKRTVNVKRPHDCQEL